MRKAIVLVVFVGVALFLAWSFSASPLPETTLDAVLALPPAAQPPEMTLQAIPSGSMQTAAAFAYRGGGFSTRAP